MDRILEKLKDSELEHLAEEPRYYFDDSIHRHIIDVIENYKFSDLMDRKVPIRKCYRILFKEKKNKNDNKSKEYLGRSASNFLGSEEKPSKLKRMHANKSCINISKSKITQHCRIILLTTKTYEKKINLKLNYDIKNLDVTGRLEALRIKELYDADNTYDAVKRKIEKMHKFVEERGEKLKKIRDTKNKEKEERQHKRNHKLMINTYMEKISENLK